MFLHSTLEANGLLIWTIARPERRNALGTTIGLELDEKLDELATAFEGWLASDRHEAPPCRSLALRAATGESAERPVWIAGGDLKELAELENVAEGRAYAHLFQRITERLESLPVPVMTLIDGRAIGGGVELTLAATLRLATVRSAFEFKQLEIGLVTGYGGARRLVELVGASRAMGWLMLAAAVDAHTAEQSGLVHQVVADETALLALARRHAAHFARLDPEAVAAQKAMLIEATRAGSRGVFDAELDRFASLWMKPAHKNALASFKGMKGTGRNINAGDGRE